MSSTLEQEDHLSDPKIVSRSQMYDSINDLKCYKKNSSIKEATKVNYRTKFKKCGDLGIDLSADQEQIIEKINEIKSKELINNVLSYLNVAVVLRRHFGLGIEKLVEKRTQLTAEAGKKATDSNKKIKDLPNTEKMYQYLDHCFLKKDYRRYIVNFLIMYTYCRNKDLVLEIVDDTHTTDPTKNYIKIGGIDSIKFIRNNYKTSDKYGDITIEITDPRLYRCCLELKGSDTCVPLLNNSEQSLASCVRNLTIGRIGQGKMFKALLIDISKSKLISVGKMRGTSASVILTNYDTQREF